ncbi:GPO family capsid scaffolding protein [Marinomonas atlantica]|uniref:GPO family capsid scaffolding protein n=1 Tax=Marinomonas atlantica TaxID=1806668 RepID=UPI000835581C|nr:GPO family capsid scaffolding protein [Marinomonas atlantica]
MAKNSKWFKVATSGPTVDGREIKEQWIKDMAETYDPAEYTANIFQDHWSWYGNYGRVTAVKAEKDGKGRLCLFAQVEANKLLLKLNEAGQKLFTSIRVLEDFANTGKAYLMHLAITDEPASLGTEQLSFSAKGEESLIFANQDGTNLEFDQLTDDELEAEARKRPGFFERLFSKHSPEQENDDMSKAALEALQTKVTDLSKQVAALSGTKGDEETPPDSTDYSAEIDQLKSKIETLEKENGEYKTQLEGVDQLKTNFAQLETAFNEAMKDAGTPPPPSKGESQDTEFDLF